MSYIVMVTFLLVLLGTTPTMSAPTPIPAPPTTPAINFYKLSLQWPPSYCSSGSVTCNSPSGPTPPIFTIHGIWPQDKNDNPVPPYDSKNPCTSTPPTPVDQLRVTLMSIMPDLILLWPNLKNPQNQDINLEFWKHEWKDHGTCSDYHTQPLQYFKSALQLRHGLDPVMGLRPGSTDMVQNIVSAIRSHVGANPEITCNKKSKTGVLQLLEIRLCYQKPSSSQQLPQTIQNCPKTVGTGCGSPTTSINIPM